MHLKQNDQTDVQRRMAPIVPTTATGRSANSRSTLRQSLKRLSVSVLLLGVGAFRSRTLWAMIRTPMVVHWPRTTHTPAIAANSKKLSRYDHAKFNNWDRFSVAPRHSLSAVGAHATVPALGAMVPPTAQESEPETNMLCDQNEEAIFSSEDADIAIFDASANGATLSQVMQIPDAGINVYVFNPGQIVCEIDAVKGTSSVNGPED